MHEMRYFHSCTFNTDFKKKLQMFFKFSCKGRVALTVKKTEVYERVGAAALGENPCLTSHPCISCKTQDPQRR